MLHCIVYFEHSERKFLISEYRKLCPQYKLELFTGKKGIFSLDPTTIQALTVAFLLGWSLALELNAMTSAWLELQVCSYRNYATL